MALVLIRDMIGGRLRCQIVCDVRQRLATHSLAGCHTIGDCKLEKMITLECTVIRPLVVTVGITAVEFPRSAYCDVGYLTQMSK